MPWIRSPWWDGFWILSGLPLAVALTVLSRWVPSTPILLWSIFCTQSGHNLAPMVLAWSYDGFRALMLHRKVKFIIVPLAILIGATLIGVIAGRYVPNLRFDPVNFAIAAGPMTWAQFKNPFMAMVAFYGVWNAYHFGKQAFGVMSIYRRKSELRGNFVGKNILDRRVARVFLSQRRIDLWYCCTVIWAAMAMPFIPRLAGGIHNLTGWPGASAPVPRPRAARLLCRRAVPDRANAGPRMVQSPLARACDLHPD